MHRASGEKQLSESTGGQSAYFVWLNRGKQSLVLDLAREDDKALLAAIIAKADVLVQNLKPGAIAKLGFPLEELRRAKVSVAAGRSARSARPVNSSC